MNFRTIEKVSSLRLGCAAACRAIPYSLFLIPISVGFIAETSAQVATPTPSVTTDALAEIIVTAQKRSENMQDVPIAITAVTAEAIQSANLVTANDLPTLVSGLSIGDTALYFQPHLRGIGT